MLHGESRAGQSYVVDIECMMNDGVPCCERFSTVVRYCMKRLTADTTRLNVTGKVRYHKTVWSFMKSRLSQLFTCVWQFPWWRLCYFCDKKIVCHLPALTWHKSAASGTHPLLTILPNLETRYFCPCPRMSSKLHHGL